MTTDVDYDFTTDGGLLFLATLKEAGALPEWAASVPEAEDVEQLASSAFGNPAARLFPLHSKTAAFVSAVSSYVYGMRSGSCDERIKTACHAYGISDEVERAKGALKPAYHEAAAPESVKTAFALTMESGTGVRNYYPINNAWQVEQSALKLAQDMAEQKLPKAWFQDAAKNILKAAAEHGTRRAYIPNRVLALGEDRLPERAFLTEQIGKRKQAGVPDEALELYKEAAESVLAMDMSKEDGALFWEITDRQYAVKHAGAVAHPVFCFNSGIQEEEFAKLASSCFQLCDILIPVDALKAASGKLIASALDKEAAAVVLSARDLSDGLQVTQQLSTLDDTQQQLLLRIITPGA